MRAATFPTLQRGYHDHQADQRRIGFRSDRLRQRQQRCGGIGQLSRFAHHAGGARQDGAYRGGVGRRRQHRSDVWTPLSGVPARLSATQPGADNRLKQRIAGKPFGTVQAGARRLAAGPQTAEATAPHLIDLDAADVIMGRRPDRNRLKGQVDAGNCARRSDNRFPISPMRRWSRSTARRG
jgi:hypothetical protein